MSQFTENTKSESSKSSNSSKTILPDNFVSVMMDFVTDLTTTFPEYRERWANYHANTPTETWVELYEYSMAIYPERFFDILYQNDEIFADSHDANTAFLPGMDFKLLYGCEGVSETTKKSIWKYLQLILFMVIGDIKDKNAFKNSENLFHGIDEGELQEKLTEAMSGIGDFFKNMEETMGQAQEDTQGDGSESGSGSGSESTDQGRNPREFFEKMFGQNAGGNGGSGMPNPEDLHSHLKGLFGGKLGSLAKELMEELTDDIQEALGLNPEDMNSQTGTKDLFAKLLKNPQKFMQIVQKINAKFQEKIRKGDLSQEEIMKEAGEMMKKMKEMGGNSKQMNEMFKNMAKSMGGDMGGMGGMFSGMNKKNMRVDTNAVDRMMKAQSTRERLRAKLEKKRMEEQSKNYVIEETATGEKVYRPKDGERQERSTVRPEMSAAELDALAAEIEAVGEPSTTTAPTKSSGGAKKKKKGKGKK